MGKFNVGCKEVLDYARTKEWFNAYKRNSIECLYDQCISYPENIKNAKKLALRSLLFCKGPFTISSAFSWSASKEGHDYWATVSHRLKEKFKFTIVKIKTIEI